MASELRLYNTRTREVETFVPRNSSEVTLYSCGPTVYHFVHVGNLRTFLFVDFLKRILLRNSFSVKHVMNITDVGHLSSDADSGEDKMLKGARRENKTVWEIAEFYTQAFLTDLSKLHIITPAVLCKATEHIEEQIAQIQLLETNGYTYVAGGNVYFDSSKFDSYAQLARLKLDDSQKARVEGDPHKKNPSDFVLWFTKSKFQDQEMKWDSPWGRGYPGWHIECSAMASKYLGTQFDIHCGGIDLLPVHHTNEVAQSEAAYGLSPWVNVWMHGEFIVLNSGDKMSKSEGNFLTLSSLEQQGFDPLDFRYLSLLTHYRKQLFFSIEALTAARSSRKKLFDRILELKSHAQAHQKSHTHSDRVKEYLEQFMAAINEDLNLAKALAVLWEVLKDSSLTAHEKLLLSLEFDTVFGFNLGTLCVQEVDSSIVDLAEQRQKARDAKDWAESDRLRDEIAALGYEIRDTKEGFELRKV